MIWHATMTSSSRIKIIKISQLHQCKEAVGLGSILGRQLGICLLFFNRYSGLTLGRRENCNCAIQRRHIARLTVSQYDLHTVLCLTFS